MFQWPHFSWQGKSYGTTLRHFECYVYSLYQSGGTLNCLGSTLTDNTPGIFLLSSAFLKEINADYQ